MFLKIFRYEIQRIIEFTSEMEMKDNGYFTSPTVHGTIADLLHAKPKQGIVSIPHNATVVSAVELLKKYDYSQAPVVEGDSLLGILTEKSLLHHAIKEDATQETIKELVDVNFCVVHSDTELYVLTELFGRFETALVYNGNVPSGIVTRSDLIAYMARTNKK